MSGEQFADNRLLAEGDDRPSDVQGVVMPFPPLTCGGNRPVTWQYQLDGIKGTDEITNSVTIFSRVALEIDESGEHGFEKFAVVYLTRAEIAEILKALDEDIAAMRHHCPDCGFV
jgi:hypothetical protein